MSSPSLSERDRALLIGLADGTLSARRRAQAEARAAQIPDAERLLARQRRVATALRGGETPDPEPAASKVPALPRLSLAGVGSLAAVALLALVVVFSLNGDRSTVAQAAELAGTPASLPAPASSGPVLQASVDGVAFPDWSAEFGWHQTGARRDTLDDRETRTVFYEHMGHRVAYTIVSGPPLAVPDGARIVRRNGTEIALSRHDGRDVAVFRRGGRTCVLAGHVLRQSTLVELAAWVP